jgi:phosphate transporter
MKFSSALKFNAVPEWWDDYIAYVLPLYSSLSRQTDRERRYDALKKYIYQLEKHQAVHRRRYHDAEATESSALIVHADGEEDTDALFRPLIERERKKVEAFYTKEEGRLVQDVTELEALVHDEEERGRGDAHWVDDDDDDEVDADEEEADDAVGELPSPTGPGVYSRSRSKPVRRQMSEDTADSDMEDSLASLPPLVTTQLQRSQRRRSSSSRSPVAHRATPSRTLASRLKDSMMSSGVLGSWDGGHASDTWTATTHYAQDMRLLFKRKITNMYISIATLKSYVEVNQSGFRKILKK